MALEDLTGSKYIANLDKTNPDATADSVSQGDDHIRGIKNVLLNSFPNVTGPVTATQAQLNSTATPAPIQTPIGSVCLWAGPASPAGWLVIGASINNVSRTTYAALFAVIGTTWGAGDGSTTFSLPYIPNGYVAGNAVNIGLNGTSTGSVISHTHSEISSVYQVNNNTYYLAAGYGHYVPSAATTGATGGGLNVAAQKGFYYIIRYI